MSINLTQAGIGELLSVSPETVQSWETGRRPLVNMRYTELQRIRRTLHVAGVSAELLIVWDRALEADSVLDEFTVDDPSQHPLALIVPNRLLSELLAWPLSGQPPRQLVDHAPRLHLAPAVQDELAHGLRSVTDAADQGMQSAMLRRQAKFFVSGHAKSQDWIEDVTARELRAQSKLNEWSPEWTVARSHAVSKAIEGDPEPLQNFARTGLSGDKEMEANLRYWAYWVGEINEPWTSDAEMLSDTQTWSGQALLDSLIKGLESAPYRELCAHSIWALVKQRSSLTEPRTVAQRLTSAIAEACDSTDGTLSEAARRRLGQVEYRIGSS